MTRNTTKMPNSIDMPQAEPMTTTLAELLALLPGIMEVLHVYLRDDHSRARLNGLMFVIEGYAGDAAPFRAGTCPIEDIDRRIVDRRMISQPLLPEVQRVLAAKQEPVLLVGCDGWKLVGVRPAHNTLHD